MQHVNYEEQQKTENEEASNSAVLTQILTAHSKTAIEASPQRYIGQSFQTDDEITDLENGIRQTIKFMKDSKN